jgi:hypothetical protein
VMVVVLGAVLVTHMIHMLCLHSLRHMQAMLVLMTSS